ncbi:hypothetical protein SASPL_133511 [Salvia splendens]|uniref:Putative gamma-glutamylcyclotransferase n=1 Tax=Salvia splendens TaxID=180675 RepID=A0A8X8ZI43_SALSN|nr:hypothetical protein SASPL_133511 [Salvia splendens]
MASAPISNVFVYGSLLADDVVRALLGRLSSSSQPVSSHLCSGLVSRNMFTLQIIRVEDKKVDGRVLLGITPPELHILDEFEDERERVDVILKDGMEKLIAITYVWENKTDPNLYGSWDFEEWKILHMDGFLKMTKGFMNELELPDANTRVATYDSFYEGMDNKHSIS